MGSHAQTLSRKSEGPAVVFCVVVVVCFIKFFLFFSSSS